jgi:hypothetical protein
MSAAGMPQWSVDRAFEEMTASFERFCLAAGLEALGAMLEAAKGFRGLKAKRQLPKLRAALLAHRQKLDPPFSVAHAQQAA